MKHTPTPWKVSATGGLIVNPIETICRGFRPGTDEFPNWKENARRIVACVNACEGLKTEELEKMPGGLWKDVFVDSLDKDVLIDELKTQNARLLEALNRILAFNLESDGATEDWNPAEATAEAWLKLKDKK